MLGLSSSTTEFRPTAPPSAPEELSSEGNTTAPRSTCTPFSAGPYPFRMRAAGLSTTMRRRKTGKLLNLSRPHIPLIFDGSWDDRFDRYGSVDFIDFLFSPAQR
ncbi:hypothetical protein MUCCIDRAFT_113787 [Mucor lusitanicus CBS 277.49]|uniref:Uncharacterized protein n=1 Tax=Mucor lusitanicus CBS 277.49 TaxID=747725 RepID=A0A162QAM9_MUCCL|nr:hypothetical protein MUCCIDRAFT_113787 [Mucor lusitanicus CBS 277.49]